MSRKSMFVLHHNGRCSGPEMVQGHVVSPPLVMLLERKFQEW